MENPATQSCTICPGALRLITGLFWMILAAAVMLALLILLLPQQVFLALSNYLQIIAALGGAAAIAVLYYRCGRKSLFSYAAGGFALWGISNIAWYVTVAMGMRAMVFPSLIDMGIIASIFLLMLAFQNGCEKKPFDPRILLGILLMTLIAAVGILVLAGFSLSGLVTFLYFLACGALIITALSRGLRGIPALLLGAVLFALAFMAYPVREMFFSTIPALSIVGSFVTAGLALMVLGFVQAALDTACH